MFGKSKPDTKEYPHESIAQDLCNLRINTILKSSINSDSMPAVRFALCDIASRYGGKLIELGASVDTIKPDGKTQGGHTRFDIFAQVAKAMLKGLEQKPADNAAIINMLLRIQNNSNRLKFILTSDNADDRNDLPRVEIAQRLNKGLDDLTLQRADSILVRKLWSLGVEEIAMQTVIELDGDVTTRIQPRFSKDDSATLHQLHSASVELSYRYWQSMIKLIGEMFNTVLSSVFGAKKSP